MQRLGQRDVCQHNVQGGVQRKLHAKQAQPLSGPSTAVVGAQTPGTETHSPSLASCLFISLSDLKQLFKDYSLHIESCKPYLSSILICLQLKQIKAFIILLQIIGWLSHRGRLLLELLTTLVDFFGRSDPHFFFLLIWEMCGVVLHCAAH